MGETEVSWLPMAIAYLLQRSLNMLFLLFVFSTGLLAHVR